MMNYKFLFTIIILLLGINCANCANIVYPKKDNVEINAPKTFFIGSEKPNGKLTINDEEVQIHPSGGFNHPVNLNFGENKFIIDNGADKQIYTIFRNEPQISNNVEFQEITYKKHIIGVINQDNTPIRSTAIDYGTNRIQHLQKGIPLYITGEYGNFYKIKLDSETNAWIEKEKVNITENSVLTPAHIISYEYNESKKSRIFKLKLNKRIAYSLIENDGLDLSVYNIEGFEDNTFKFHINKIHQLYGYKSYYSNDNELIIEVKNIPQKDDLKSIKITIDPGHGGEEVGAIGCLGDKEKDVNLKIALKLKENLEHSGMKIFITRTDDTQLELQDRVNFANKNSDIFISLHCNALPDARAGSPVSGSEGYYYYPQAKKLSDDILKGLAKITELPNRGSIQQSFAVVRNTENISVLIEVGYLINPDDNSKLVDEEFQSKIAQGIYQGIEKFINELQ